MSNSIYRVFGFTIISVLLFNTMLSAQKVEHINMSDLLTPKTERFSEDDVLQKAVLLELNTDFLERSFLEKHQAISLQLPINNEEIITIEVEQFNLLSKDFILRTSSGDTLQYEPGLHYRGKIVDKEGFCTINIFPDHMSGLISIIGEGDYNLGRMEGQRNIDYILYNDRNLKVEQNTECHTPDPEFGEFNHNMEVESDQRFTDCVKIYVEGDFALNQNKGGVSPATDYILELFAEVATVYDADDIGIEISEIMVWDSPDGYSTSDSYDALDQFTANNPNYNGNMAHLFALGGNGLGGLADVPWNFCNSNPYAYSNISAWFNSYPNYSWTVEVVSHEMGHNFGCSHTHSCVWNGNNTQIDDCGNEYSGSGGSCYDENDPILPASGTIMSYCHLIGGVGIDLALGFGTQPGNFIRSKYDNANCLSSCNGPVPDAPIAEFDADDTDICEESFLQYYDLSANNPTAWDWDFEGGDPSFSEDEEPYIYYEYAGTYDVTLIASNIGGDDELYMPDYLTVHEAPEVSFTYDISNGNQVSFISEVEDGLYYFWDFDDGFSSDDEHPDHTFSYDGSFEVTLFVGNDYCSDVAYSQTINIATEPTAGMTIPDYEGCAPFTVEFQDNSSSNVTNWLWEFDGGTPDTSYVENPEIVFNNPGTYSVSLTVSNALFSNSISYTDTIIVLGPPTAGFTPAINGNTVTFTNTSTAADTSIWNFGDGNSSGETNPVHLYAEGGTYDVQLIAGNDCGYDTSSFELQITLQPVASFQVSASDICVNDTAFFTSLSNTNEIQWIFEGGEPGMSTVINPEVVYDTPGTYTVTQYAYNDLGGDTLVIEDYINVMADPTGTFQSNVDGYNVLFDQNLNFAQSFLWEFGDGNTSENEDPSHTYDEDGSYEVKLTVFGLCDTIQLNETVTIANPPIAAFSMDINSGCAPITVEFTNNSSNNSDEFIWTFAGGTPNTSTEANPTVSYTTAGTFSVMLQAINEQGQDVMLQEGVINVLGIPNVNFTYDSELLAFTFFYPGNAGDEVSWDFGDGNSSNDLNPTHTFNEEGFYTVTLIASNDCGENEISLEIEVAIKPDANFAYDSDEGCAPLVVNYENQTTGNPSSILWFFDGGNPSTSTDENPEVTYYFGGNFSTQLVAFSANGSDTLVLEEIIHVDDGPNPSFYFSIAGSTVSFTNTTENGDSYIWNFGDGSASTEEEPSHSYAENGTYTVTLYASNECGQKTKEIKVTITTVNIETLYLSDFKLYPNPNNGQFGIEFNSAKSDEMEVKIYNLVGKILYKESFQPNYGLHRESIDADNLNSGLYILEISQNGKFKRLKFAVN